MKQRYALFFDDTFSLCYHLTRCITAFIISGYSGVIPFLSHIDQEDQNEQDLGRGMLPEYSKFCSCHVSLTYLTQTTIQPIN